MKFSLKIFLVLCLTVSLGLGFSSVFAQTTDIDSVTSPTTVKLNSVFVVNDLTNTNNDLRDLNAWAVGDGGTILYWDGNAWSSVDSPTSENLYSVIFVDDSNGWAVGGGSASGVILRYDGEWSVWERISFTGFTDTFDTINNTLYSITVTTDGTTGWIVGDDGITLNLSEDTWFAIPDVSPNTLRSVAMAHGSTAAWR